MKGRGKEKGFRCDCRGVPGSHAGAKQSREGFWSWRRRVRPAINPVTLSINNVSVDGPVVFWKMALEVAVIVKDTGHFNYPVSPAAIEKKMARFLDPWTAQSGSAERNVVSPRPGDHDLRTFFRSWAVRIGFDIEQRLPMRAL